MTVTVTVRLSAPHTFSTHGETYALVAGDNAGIPQDVAEYILSIVPDATITPEKKSKA